MTTIVFSIILFVAISMTTPFSGQERFQSITNRFYSDTQAVIIVYDITSEDSLQDIEFWVKEVQYYLLRELEDGMPAIFVGNKKDVVDKLEYYHTPGYTDNSKDTTYIFRQVQEISNSHSFLRPVECSAKTGENVQRIFDTIARELVRQKNVKPSRTTTKVVGPGGNSFCSGIC